MGDILIDFTRINRSASSRIQIPMLTRLCWDENDASMIHLYLPITGFRHRIKAFIYLSLNLTSEALLLSKRVSFIYFLDGYACVVPILNQLNCSVQLANLSLIPSINLKIFWSFTCTYYSSLIFIYSKMMMGKQY
jgi:hypothetical protein